MSLVNDMLRDLDKRRKETGGSAASVKLTPAPEIAEDVNKRSVIVYLVAALIIGAGAIAWFWSQQEGGASTRQLDIAPAIVSEPNIVVPEEAVEFQETEPAQPPARTTEPVIDAGPINVELAQERPTRSDIVDNESVSEPQPAQPAGPGRDAGSEGPANNSEVEDIASIASDSEPSSEDRESVESEALVVDLSDQPAQEVKNSAELTPEETDLLAVQDALGLIAENRLTEAYSALEQQIVENRYAHQSRETYAKLLMSEGNLLGAYELNEAGLALTPNHSGFKKIKARLLIADGQLDAAVDLLLTRAPAVDIDLEYHDILATAQLASRDFEGALISYTELVQQDQNQGKWWYGFAASQDSLGNLNAARQGYSQAVRLSNLSANLRQRSQERLSVLSQ